MHPEIQQGFIILEHTAFGSFRSLNPRVERSALQSSHLCSVKGNHSYVQGARCSMGGMVPVLESHQNGAVA